jgi:excisionase family DNA binding protein
MPELMTVREVAEYLRVTQKTVYRLLQRSSIPALKVSHSWRFDKAVIDEWLRKSAIGVKANILVVDDDAAVRTLTLNFTVALICWENTLFVSSTV